MALYLITYDQHRDRDYTPIWTRLRAWGAKRILESVWLVSKNANAADMREELKTVTRSEDSLFIMELKVGSGWATYNTQAEGTDWMKTHIP